MSALAWVLVVELTITKRQPTGAIDPIAAEVAVLHRVWRAGNIIMDTARF